MRFYKMHGIGNDYVYVDCFHGPPVRDPSALAIAISRPHYGVGADGLILIEPSMAADARMRVFNADGSEAKMCGNGIRCVGKYLYDSGLRRKQALRVETASGVKALEMRIESGVAVGARVDMGAPEAAPAPVPIAAAGREFLVHPVSMGNPHAVVFLEEALSDADFAAAGPEIERHPRFPDRANVEFCLVEAPDRLRVRVWERGSGETLACGTGACAALVAACLQQRTGRAAEVSLRGGSLLIEWGENGRVYMTGPAELAFAGEWRDDR